MKCYPGDAPKDNPDGPCNQCEADNALTPSPGGAYHWSPQDRKDCFDTFTKIFTSQGKFDADASRKYATCVVNKFASDAVYTWNEISEFLAGAGKQPGLDGYMDVVGNACAIPEGIRLNSSPNGLGGVPATCTKDADCGSGYVCSNGKCSKESSHLVTYLLIGGGAVLLLLFVLYMTMSRRSAPY